MVEKQTNSGNLVLFFGRPNSRFESHLQKYGEGKEIYSQLKRLKAQYIGIFEEIDSIYGPKMHFLKEGQKIQAWEDPPPLFGQCPKENVFFPLRPSLRHLHHEKKKDGGPCLRTNCNLNFEFGHTL